MGRIFMHFWTQMEPFPEFEDYEEEISEEMNASDPELDYLTRKAVNKIKWQEWRQQEKCCPRNRDLQGRPRSTKERYSVQD